MDKLFNLKLGKPALYSGPLVTLRDRASKEILLQKKCPVDLSQIPIFHAGPIMLQEKKEYVAKACGPTTSMRMEEFTPSLMKEFGAKVFIGKGGMGELSLNAFKDYKGRYFHTVGGVASLLAKKIKKVEAVYFKEFGMAEAMWLLFVEDFPLTLTMDEKGNSLHNEVLQLSKKNLQKFL